MQNYIAKFFMILKNDTFSLFDEKEREIKSGVVVMSKIIRFKNHRLMHDHAVDSLMSQKLLLLSLINLNQIKNDVVHPSRTLKIHNKE